MPEADGVVESDALVIEVVVVAEPVETCVASVVVVASFATEVDVVAVEATRVVVVMRGWVVDETPVVVVVVGGGGGKKVSIALYGGGVLPRPKRHPSMSPS